MVGKVELGPNQPQIAKRKVGKRASEREIGCGVEGPPVFLGEKRPRFRSFAQFAFQFGV